MFPDVKPVCLFRSLGHSQQANNQELHSDQDNDRSPVGMLSFAPAMETQIFTTQITDIVSKKAEEEQSTNQFKALKTGLVCFLKPISD